MSPEQKEQWAFWCGVLAVALQAGLTAAEQHIKTTPAVEQKPRPTRKT